MIARQVGTYANFISAPIGGMVGQWIVCKRSSSPRSRHGRAQTTLQPIDGRQRRPLPDDLQLSDIEDRFTCTPCGKRGADVRPDFNWHKMPIRAMGYASCRHLRRVPPD